MTTPNPPQPRPRRRATAPPPPPPPPPTVAGRVRNRWNSMQDVRQVNVPPGVPQWLGDNRIVWNCWAAAMALVCFDEWHNYHILPRPQRLWETSLFFGLLAATDSIDILIPIANAFAIGMLIILLYQYWEGDSDVASGA